MKFSITKTFGAGLSRIAKSLFWWTLVILLGLIMFATWNTYLGLSESFYSPWNYRGRAETRNPIWIFIIPFALIFLRLLYLKYADKIRRIAILERYIMKNHGDPDIVSENMNAPFSVHLEPENPEDRPMKPKDADLYRQSMASQVQMMSQMMMAQMMNQMNQIGNGNKERNPVGFTQGNTGNQILDELRKLNNKLSEQ